MNEQDMEALESGPLASAVKQARGDEVSDYRVARLAPGTPNAIVSLATLPLLLRLAGTGAT